MAKRASIGQLAQWACTLEVLAPKAGNVHPQAAFDDMDWRAFVLSASAIRPVFDRAGKWRVGQLVLAGVRATRAAVSCNTNLGILLLLSVLAKAKPGSGAAGIRAVLRALTPRDARDVYEAIRLAQPGGLGSSDEADVRGPAPESLVAAMRLAAARDDIARQYTNAFADVRAVRRDLVLLTGQGHPLNDAIVTAHLRQLARRGDSLIARKLGVAASREAQRRAAAVLAAGFPEGRRGRTALTHLDRWLRQRKNQRNPGASADLIAAGIFQALRDRDLSPPFFWTARVSWRHDEGVHL
jgi:triphosphoribosyl-dephospho-CoA synthase